MSNIEKANKILLESTNKDSGYIDIQPLIENGIPRLATIKKYNTSEEYLYYIDSEEKFFLKVSISEECESASTSPRYTLSSRYDNVVDSYLSEYPPYIYPEESLIQFVNNDLPKLADHDRDKNIYVLCYTDAGQGNIGHFVLNPKLLETLSKSGLTIHYTVMLQLESYSATNSKK